MLLDSFTLTDTLEVDPALGFAVAVTYWLAQCLSMAALTSGAARIANDFAPSGSPPLDKGKRAGIVVGLLTLTLLSNICGVKVRLLIEILVNAMVNIYRHTEDWSASLNGLSFY